MIFCIYVHEHLNQLMKLRSNCSVEEPARFTCWKFRNKRGLDIVDMQYFSTRYSHILARVWLICKIWIFSDGPKNVQNQFLWHYKFCKLSKKFLDLRYQHHLGYVLKLHKYHFSQKIRNFFEKCINFQKFWRLRCQSFGIFRNFFRPKVGIFLKKSLPP